MNGMQKIYVLKETETGKKSLLDSSFKKPAGSFL